MRALLASIGVHGEDIRRALLIGGWPLVAGVLPAIALAQAARRPRRSTSTSAPARA